jgi:hypothetical protein
MAWVVTSWRTEELERMLSAEARAALDATRAAADRDARRARRAADRTASGAAAELEALERLCLELRDTVRRARASAPPAETRAPEPCPAAAPVLANVPAARRRRPGRASMHSTALGELFRATTAG